MLIVAWLLLSVRYRSFTGGSIAMLRYGRYGLRRVLALAARNALGGLASVSRRRR